MFGSCHFDRSSKVEIGVKFWIFVYFFVFYHLKKNHATFSRSWRCPKKFFTGTLETKTTEIIQYSTPISTFNNLSQWHYLHIKQNKRGFFHIFFSKRSVCVDMYPKNPAKFSECVLSLTALEVASNSVDSICQISQFPRCDKLVKICHKAKGQLISECLLGVIEFPKNQRTNW